MIREGKGTGERRNERKRKNGNVLCDNIMPCSTNGKKKAVTCWIPLNFLDHSVDLSTEVKYAVQTILSYSSQTVDRYITIKVQ